MICGSSISRSRVPSCMGDQEGLAAAAAPPREEAGPRHWSCQAHGIWTRSVPREVEQGSGASPGLQEDPNTSRSAEPQADRFMDIADRLFTEPSHIPQQGVVFTTAQGWRVWQEVSPATPAAWAGDTISGVEWRGGKRPQ